MNRRDTLLLSVAGLYSAGMQTAESRPVSNEGRFVSVKAFGAVGDGKTDDTAAMQAAHDMGGVVYYPAGNYLFKSIEIRSGGIVGSGPTLQATLPASGTILRPVIGTAPDRIAFVGNALDSNAPIFRDFTMLGDENSADIGSGLSLRSGRRLESCFADIFNVVFRYIDNCINIEAGILFTIRQCNLQFYGGDAVRIGNEVNADAGDSAITGCSFFNGDGSRYGQKGVAVRQISSGGLRITDCKFNGGEYGYVLDLNGSTSVIILQANSLENISRWALNFRNNKNDTMAPVRFQNINICSNEFGYNAGDICFEEIANHRGTSYWDNIVVSANVFYTSRDGATAAPIQIRSSRYFAITNNVFNANVPRSSAAVGVETSETGIVGGNIVHGFKGGDVSLSKGAAGVSRFNNIVS